MHVCVAHKTFLSPNLLCFFSSVMNFCLILFMYTHCTMVLSFLHIKFLFLKIANENADLKITIAMYGVKVNSGNFTAHTIPHTLYWDLSQKKTFKFFWSVASSVVSKSYYIQLVFLTLGIIHGTEPTVTVPLFWGLVLSTSISTEVLH